MCTLTELLSGHHVFFSDFFLDPTEANNYGFWCHTFKNGY